MHVWIPNFPGWHAPRPPTKLVLRTSLSVLHTLCGSLFYLCAPQLENDSFTLLLPTIGGMGDVTTQYYDIGQLQPLEYNVSYGVGWLRCKL